MSVPQTKSARQGRIAELVRQRPIHSQAELGSLLLDDGIEVTQATLSRDLDEIGATKVTAPTGESVYALQQEAGEGALRSADQPGDSIGRLGRIAADLVVSVAGSANIVVLRTPPGAAQYLASKIDNTSLPEIIGSVAGDDTVLLVTAEPSGAPRLADELLALIESRNRRG